MKFFLEKICWMMKKFKAILSVAKLYLAFKEQLNWRRRTEEINSTELDLPSIQDPSTATAFSFNLFNVTPHLKEAAIVQKPETVSSTSPPFLNLKFLTPPPTVETPSPSRKRKRPRTQFVNYLDDVDDAYGKQKRRAWHKRFRANLSSIPRAKKLIDFFIVVM